MPISPSEFVTKWSQSELREQQAAQSHFNDLCALVGHKTPTDLDPKGEFFVFENHVEKATGGKGRADVWYKGHFAWEYKGKHKDLDAAYAQISAYRGGLDNPPLLVVCDFLEYRIYPQWPNSSGQPFVFHNADLLNREAQNYIRWLLESPERFLEARLADAEQRQALTEKLARKFAMLADLMRQHRDAAGQPVWDTMQIARFLTKLVFILFTEDIELMPRPGGQRIISYLVEGGKELPEAFAEEVQRLFQAMNGETTGYSGRAVPYFNGGLFQDSTAGNHDGTEVLNIVDIPDAINVLEEVSEADWRRVDPAIFGTLFEGALDPGKRAQLGAHFTSEQDIRLIVEPVLMDPLNRAWDALRVEAEPLLQAYLNDGTPRAKAEAEGKLTTLYEQMMTRLEGTTVLDPACGSGNFLYVSLRVLKDLEAKVRKFFEPLGLPFRDVVTPRQLYGIEKDPFAAKLAHVVAWIGYLQWRYEDEGVLHPQLPRSRPHPRQLPHPILRDKNSPDEPDRIQNRDAIMAFRFVAASSPGQELPSPTDTGEGEKPSSPTPPYEVGRGEGVGKISGEELPSPNPSPLREEGRWVAVEPDWPEATVIMGNPPFLGGSKLRGEIGDTYYETLTKLYAGRVPGGADLVTYWFEKARNQIEQGKTQRAGLLSTNSIRGGANREVLKRIKDSGDIFMAWADRPWILEGAAVRVSMVAFDDGTQPEKRLNGEPSGNINPDLTGAVDITKAKHLGENEIICFMGPSPKGPFDIEAEIAKKMISADDKNTDVVRPVVSAIDIVRNSRDMWTIDFALMSEEEAKKYELPYTHIKNHVYPIRSQNRRAAYAGKWWQYAEARPGMRNALREKDRFLATPAVAKHRLFVWVKSNVICNQGTLVFARDDDYFFGVLHSKLHEVWSLRMGTWLGKGNDPRYTPTTTFETFPFPWSPGQEDQTSLAYQAISAAAKSLHEERDAWLNPDDDLLAGPERAKMLKQRTLTTLYNALADLREKGRPNNGKALTPAQTFAPRLDELHRALDAAVCAAYGWSDLAESLSTPEGEETVLRRLLALNLERAGGSRD